MAKKKQPGKKGAKSKAVTKPVLPNSVGDENPFDFGGLPQRDLKKNLGCG